MLRHGAAGAKSGDFILSETAMPNPRLLPELRDHIIDLLHNQPRALKDCCLVSKPWIPHTRKHLFADIGFPSSRPLKSWKETFPDPSNSSAYHAHTLFVGCPQVVEEADVEGGGWIQALSRVEQLMVNCASAYFSGATVSLAPFSKLSSPSA